MKKCVTTRLLSLLLTVALLCGLAVPMVSAAPADTQALRFEKVDRTTAMDDLGLVTEKTEQEAQYKESDIVRVSIVLEKKSTLEAGFSTKNIADNKKAMAYRAELASAQEAVTRTISKEILGGKKLDVVWNLTLAANIISANVPYGQIDAIAAADGVKEVVLETRYEPCVVDREEVADPNMATSGAMIGRNDAYAAGYTGAGTRIAIIDTGLDTDHQSFSAAAYRFSLSMQAAQKFMPVEEYLAELDLLTAEEVAEKLPELNISAVVEAEGYSSADLYQNDKAPFAFNYVDLDLDVTHDNDEASEHGSHVAGIAAANAYIPTEGGYERALDSVLVQGVAPDAQLVIMKVFGKNGGAYDSDYMVAIEDAIVLGCDSVNLSLGSGNPGFGRSSTELYRNIFDSLTDSDTVVAISSGNSGSWVDSAYTGGYLYSEDVSMDTVGSPASFTNSLSIASVDNAGTTGYYFTVGDTAVFYNETVYSNVPIATLAGEQTYILVDGIGTPEDFAAVGDVLKGKIAVCYRGETSFSEKANAAVAAGAIATVVINNQSGIINMDLTDYRYTAPCVSVMQTYGEAMLAAAEPVTDADGNVLYYTGKLTQHDEMSSTVYETDYYTMSDFSAWGVPGTLEMKPEITAPGGMIYSVNGAVADGTAYEVMSGTSMAAPQVAGMAALAAQYIEANGLAEQTGLRVRQLTQSLLMSTAQPMLDANGSYYSVLQQGAGLADIGDVIRAQSYIWMDEDATASASDGKVKVELGDDPDRGGVYTFSFTLNNLNDRAKEYTLGGELFTQGCVSDGVDLYMDKATASLGASAVYTVNGERYLPLSRFDCDLDADGDTDADDAQIILNYATGLQDEIADAADLNLDGAVDTYDAHLLLASMQTGSFTLAAGDSVEVTVEFTLSADVKAALDQLYPNGAYIQGYTYVYPVTTEEGEIEDVTHSIPVLGFYGNWSDPSMFDQISYTNYVYGDPTVPYVGVAGTNNLLIKHRGSNTMYWQIGNPYVIEESYPAGKEAIRSSDTLAYYRATLIRNAAAMTVMITDQNGEVLHLDGVSTDVPSAFYYVNGGQWENTYLDYSINKKVSSLNLSEGDCFTVSLVAVPEYYTKGENLSREDMSQLLDSGVLGNGTILSTSLTVDDSAPEILDITKSLTSDNLIVKAQDNRHVAAVIVANAAGSEVYARAVGTADETNAVEEITIDLSQAQIGAKCLVVVADYAGNETSYLVEYGGSTENFGGRMFGFTMANNFLGASGPRWFEIEPEKLHYNWGSTTGMKLASATDLAVNAAEYVDGYVYMAASDGWFYVAEQGGWSNYARVGYYADVTPVINDMAFNYADGKLYAVGEANIIYSVDLNTGAMTEEMRLTLTNPETTQENKLLITNLAIDDKGTFYGMNPGSALDAFLYRWTREDLTDGVLENLAPVGNTSAGKPAFMGCLAWDHDKDVLYWATSMSTNATMTNSGSNMLMVLNTETGVAQKAAVSGQTTPDSVLNAVFTSLYIVPSGGSYIDMVDTATSIALDPTEITVLPGMEFGIHADVYPWNLKNTSVRWTSSDETVATVEDGFVTALKPGTATITATTNAAPGLSAACVVTVSEMPDIQLSGLVYDPDGTTFWSEFTATEPENWTAVSGEADHYYAGAMVDGVVYVHDTEKVYGVDPDTFQTTDMGEIAVDWVWSDAAGVNTNEEGNFGVMVGLSSGGTYLNVMNMEKGTISNFVLINEFLADPMAAIAFIRYSEYDYYGTIYPSAIFHVITENGELFEFELRDEGKSYALTATYLGSTGLSLGSVSGIVEGAYASMIFDEASGYLVLSSHNGGITNQIYLIDPETCLTTLAGEFGDEIWPAVSLYQYTRVTELTVRLKPTKATIYAQDTVQLSGRVLPAHYDEALVWSSSDESIATVDENGLVTGVSEGTATITATTVATNEAGETASASCSITVLGLAEVDATLGAQVITESGEVQWVTIDTSDLSKYTVNAKGETALVGGGAYDGKIYGSEWDLDGNSASALYMIDIEDGFKQYSGLDNMTASSAIVDATASPAETFNASYYQPGEGYLTKEIEAFGAPMILSIGQSLMLLQDYTTAEVSSVTSLVYAIPNVGAIAYTGTSYGYNNAPSQIFKVLDADGMLWNIAVDASYYSYMNSVSYYASFMPVGAIGVTFEKYAELSMEYVKTETLDGLVIAYTGNGAAELYWVDLTAQVLSAQKIGNVAGAKTVTALYTSASLKGEAFPASVNAAAEICRGTADISSSPMILSMGYEQQEPMTTEVAEFGAAGSLNVSSGAAAQPMAIESKDAAVSDGTAVITLTEDMASTNGLITLHYDADVLTYTGLTSALLHAVNVDAENGLITFAYAAAAEIGADSTLAAVSFSYAADSVDTEVEITTLERGAEKVEETVSVAVVAVTDDPVTPPEPSHDCLAEQFEDVDLDAWYHESIDYVLENGIMKGMSETSFGPNLNVTRAQIVTILYRAAGSPEHTADVPFTDLADGAYYLDAVAWAYENEIVKGMSDTTFAPDASITREQLVTFLYRYAQWAEVDTSAAADLSAYADADTVSDWAETAMKWAVAEGYVKGMGDQTLAPTGTATRAQAAEILMRFEQA